MLSSNASKVLKLMRAANGNNNRIMYSDLMETFHWTREQAVSACDQLFEKGLAKQIKSNPVKGEPFPCGLVLKEEGRFYYQYMLINAIKASFLWILEHIVELVALILAIVSFMNSLE